MHRASDETFWQRWVRRWVRAQFRGGERPVPTPGMPGQNVNTLDDHLASGRFERWADRWFWLVMGIVVALSAVASIAVWVADRSAPWWVLAFGGLLVVFAGRILAGVRCLFRHRHRPRRAARR